MRQIVRALRNQVKLAPRRLVKVRDRLLARARRPPVPRCGWLLAEENATGHGRAGVTLRRYPYPYRCALAISNDTDWMSAQAFHEWHAFVNGTKPTVLGQGLGLEVGDSYWVWSENKYFSLYHSAPYETDLRVSPESERLVELGGSDELTGSRLSEPCGKCAWLTGRGGSRARSKWCRNSTGISWPTEGKERGEPLDYSAMRRERNSQHHAQQHFRGAVAVWECEFEKPYA